MSERLNKNSLIKSIVALRGFVLVVFAWLLTVHVIIEEKALNVFVQYVLNEKLGISQFYVIFILLIPLILTINNILSRKKILVNSVILTLLMAFVFLLGNKTSFLMVSFIIGIKFLLLYKNKRQLYLFTGVILVSLVVMAFAYSGSSLQKKVNVVFKTTDLDIEIIKTKNSVTFTKNTFEHRILINYLTIQEIAKSLPFGVGTGDYQNVLDFEYKTINFKQGLRQRLNNHNQYLSEFLKTGVFGGFVFIFLIILLLNKANINNQYYIFIIVPFAIGCLFESYLDRQHGVIIFAFLIPLFLKYENDDN